MNTINIFDKIPKASEDESFENIIKNDKVKIQRIVSHGHTSPKEGWYEAATDEWVIILEGEAIVTFKNGEEVKLKRGDYFNIPAHSKHKVSWTLLNADTVWLVVHY